MPGYSPSDRFTTWRLLLVTDNPDDAERICNHPTHPQAEVGARFPIEVAASLFMPLRERHLDHIGREAGILRGCQSRDAGIDGQSHGSLQGARLGA
ncbi:MAG: hypothetical protein HQM03_12520 [Magnetococcales bacterium]|nr:hypothetical protein [Magnetococcales bacterium]